VARRSGVRYYSPQLRYLRAELLFEAGRHAEALPWFGAAAEGYGVAPLLAQLQPRQAQIYERLGNHPEAARHYARFTSLWRECDDVSRPALAEASRRLGQLAVR
jgi:tetratricopeptide (TPR) repeat protein